MNNLFKNLEVQPVLEEAESESDETLGSESDSDKNVVEVPPPGVVRTPPRLEVTAPSNKGDNNLNVPDLDDVTSPAREFKSPSKEDDVTPKVGMAASPSEALRTPSRDKAATPSEQDTTTKKLPQGVEGVTAIKESEEEIEKEINKIRDSSQQMTTPQKQNQFIIDNYWRTVGASAKNLKFSKDDLKKKTRN